MYWNRFDICRAYYWFAANYHTGQWSEEYTIFGRLDKLRYKPSPLDHGPQRNNLEDENCRSILANLIRRQRKMS